MTLYIVAVVDEENILIPPTPILANDEKSAIAELAQQHPAVKFRKATVLSRPF